MDYLVRKDTGTRLAYEFFKARKSQAESVIFIHGLSLDHNIWSGVVDGFRGDYHILLYDLCGHGQSDAVTQPLSWDLMVNGLKQLAHHLKVKRCHIIGHGFGGIIGIRFARQWAGVRSLTLVSTPLYFPQEIYSYEYSARSLYIKDHIESFAERIIQSEVVGTEQEKRALIENAVRKVDPDMYRKGVRLIFGNSHSLMEHLPGIRVPTLLINGDRNPIFPPHYIALYGSVIPASRVQIFPNARNAVFIDHPELFIRSVREFWANPPESSHPPSYHFLLKKMREALENAYKMEVAAPVLEIRTIGKFSVKWRGLPVDGTWTRRSSRELLLYLALEKSVPREALIDAFFSEVDAEKAKNYLRVMLNHLKSIFESTGDAELINALKVTRGSVSLQCHVNSDVARFMHALHENFHEGRNLKEMKAEFLHLIELYQSGFLSGLNAPWIVDLRITVENKLANLLMKLVNRCEEHEAYDDALELLREGQAVEIYDGYCKEKINEIIARVRGR